jgi:hypothetical protein
VPSAEAAESQRYNGAIEECDVQNIKIIPELPNKINFRRRRGVNQSLVIFLELETDVPESRTGGFS